MNMSLKAISATALIALTAGSLQAQVVTYQGGDAGANSTDPRPFTDAAAASFDAAASAIGSLNVIDFESAPVGSFTSLLIGPGLTLTGIDYTGSTSGQSILGAAISSPENLFGYNTTSGGSNFAFFNGGALTFTFAAPVNSFGGYLSGLQLVGETVSFSDGTSQSFTIDNLGSGLQFFGFTDAGKFITSITIDTRSSSAPLGDFVGLDDVRYGVAVSVAPVPEPETYLLMLAGLGALGAAARRKKALRA